MLCHPGGGVNKRHVQKVLSEAPFSDKTLTSTRFTVSYGGNQFRATLPEALYDDLYWRETSFCTVGLFAPPCFTIVSRTTTLG